MSNTLQTNYICQFPKGYLLDWFHIFEGFQPLNQKIETRSFSDRNVQDYMLWDV